MLNNDKTNVTEESQSWLVVKEQPDDGLLFLGI